MIKQCFNSDWLFKKEGVDKEFKVSLPHDSMIYEKRTKNAKTGSNGAFFQGGKYIYTKVYFHESANLNKKIFLQFDGAYNKTTIYINDVEVYHCECGYRSFVVPIHENLMVDKDNEVKVIVANDLVPNSRWYTGSGIYRDVNIFISNETYVDFYGLKTKTKSAFPAIVSVNAHIKNFNMEKHRCEIYIYEDERLIAKTTGTDVDIKIENPKFWNENTPFLYDIKATIYEDDEIIDEKYEKYGIVDIECSPKKGLIINGEQIKLKGACIHHDNGILGAAAFKTAEYRKIKKLKQAGFNAIRCAHNRMSDHLLSACDYYGMYVVNEAFDQWYVGKTKYDYAQDFDKCYKTDLENLVLTSINHPSVIMYSIGNEVSETAFDRGIQTAEEMINLIKTLDDKRLITAGISLMLNGLTAKGKGVYNGEEENSTRFNKIEKVKDGSAFINAIMNKIGIFMELLAKSKSADNATKEIFKKLDVSGYNYASCRYVQDMKKYPDRIILGTETFPKSIAKNWGWVSAYNHILGDFMWTGWDYIGEVGIGSVRYPSFKNQSENLWLLGGAGVIDILGHFRPEVFLNRAIFGFSDKPTIAVEPLNQGGIGLFSVWRNTDAISSWSWDGCENKKATILVYSNAYKIKLIINDKVVGTKKVKDCKSAFTAKYQKGTIKAVAYDKNDVVISESVLVSANHTKRLNVEVEDYSINKIDDLIYLNISITDEDGIVKVTDNSMISIKVEGDAVLQAFGSSNPFTKESFVSNKQTAYYGKVQGILRVKKTNGKIKVLISTPSADSLNLNLNIN